MAKSKPLRRGNNTKKKKKSILFCKKKCFYSTGNRTHSLLMYSQVFAINPGKCSNRPYNKADQREHRHQVLYYTTVVLRWTEKCKKCLFFLLYSNLAGWLCFFFFVFALLFFCCFCASIYPLYYARRQFWSDTTKRSVSSACFSFVSGVTRKGLLARRPPAFAYNIYAFS